MAHRQIRPKTQNYGVVQRGCSLTIPVIITDPFDKPIDLTGTEVAFTVKRRREDFDMDDSRAYIQKNFAPQEPENGRFFIQLSSKDTDFEPGPGFYFDIELTKEDGMVYRICTLEFALEGGPTNRTINEGIGQFPIGDQITIVTLEQGAPIVVVAPTVDVSAEIYSQVADMQNIIESHSTQIETIENRIITMQEEIEKLKEQENGDDTRLTEIEGNLEIAQNNIETLTNDLQAVQMNLQSLEGKVTQNEEDIEDLRDEVTVLDTKVSRYDADIAQLKSDIITINSTISDIQTSINNLEDDLTALEGTVSSLTTDMDTAKGDISTLQTDMINAKADISTLEEDISNLTTDISQAQSDATLAKTTADAAQADATTAKTNAASAQEDASNALSTVQTVQGELTQTQQDLGTVEADLETAKTNIQTNTTDIAQLKSDIEAIDGISEAPDDGLIYGRLNEAWSEITGTLVKAGYTPTLFTTDSESIADFLKAAEVYAASVATPFARFIKRTGGPIIQWTSPTAFTFSGGAYIQMSTRGQIRIMTFTQQTLSYSSGVFICFNNDTQTLTTFDMANVISLPTNYYIVGWMLQSQNGKSNVHIIDGGDYEYNEETDHSIIGDISTIGSTIELQVTETILSRLTSTGTNTAKLEIVGTTTINNVDIRRMSQYGDTSEGSSFNGITLTTTGQVIDDTVYMDSSDGGRVWICNGNAWYEMTYFVSGGGTRARMTAHRIN